MTIALVILVMLFLGAIMVAPQPIGVALIRGHKGGGVVISFSLTISLGRFLLGLSVDGDRDGCVEHAHHRRIVAYVPLFAFGVAVAW